MEKKPDLLEKLDEFIEKNGGKVDVGPALDEMNKQHVEEVKTKGCAVMYIEDCTDGVCCFECKTGKCVSKPDRTKQHTRLDRIEKLAEKLFVQCPDCMSDCLRVATKAIDAVDKWRKEQEQGGGDE